GRVPRLTMLAKPTRFSGRTQDKWAAFVSGGDPRRQNPAVYYRRTLFLFLARQERGRGPCNYRAQLGEIAAERAMPRGRGGDSGGEAQSEAVRRGRESPARQLAAAIVLSSSISAARLSASRPIVSTANLRPLCR